MSKPLTEYFKVRSKRPKLSLLKNSEMSSTPKRVKSEEQSNLSVIDLVSDDEELCVAVDLVEKELNDSGSINNLSSEIKCKSFDGLDSSGSTIIYSPSTPRKSLTPGSVSSKSPGSRDKFFSPVRKKNVKIRSPTKAKKNLSNIMNEQVEDPVLLKACAEMDDKTIFLLTTINKYLKDKELRPLLLAESQDLLWKCMHTKKPGARVVCRLYWRREGWYRMEQIRQITSEKRNDISDPVINDMIKDLIDNGLIESANYPGSKHEIEMEDCLAILKSEELKAICKDLKLKASNKSDTKECLRTYCRQKSNISSYFIGSKSDNTSRVLKMLTNKTGPCFRLTKEIRTTLDELYLLMYLGIDYNILREKRLELTLIYDKIKRECYPIDKDMPIDNASVVFKTRDEFKRYIESSNIYEEFLATTNIEEKCCIVKNVYQLYQDIDDIVVKRYKELPPWLQRFTPPYLYVKILEEGIQELKKTKLMPHITLAVDILSELISQTMFRQHRKALWYAEKALILDKLMASAEKAGQVLLEGLTSSMSEAAKDHMRPRAAALAARRSHALGRQLREHLLTHAAKEQIMERNINAHHIYKLPMDVHKNKGKIKFETRTAEGRVVQNAEEFCISQYIAEGKYTHGGHWEGRIVTTIFFLLFWDIIYARLPSVRGVYLSHYQLFPLDLFLDSFYQNRKVLIDDRLREIEESSVDDLVERMRQTWELRPETELSGITRSIGCEAACAVAAAVRSAGGAAGGAGGAAGGAGGATGRAGGAALAALCRRLAVDYRYAHSGFPDLTLWNPHTNQVKFVEVKTDSDKPSMKQIQWMHFLQENGIETEFCYVGANTTRCKARNKC